MGITSACEEVESSFTAPVPSGETYKSAVELLISRFYVSKSKNTL